MRVFLIVVLVLLISGNLGAADNLPVTRIGFILDGHWDGSKRMISALKTEILDLTRGEFDVQFPADKQIVADWTFSGIENGFQQLLADPEVDMVIPLGIIGGIHACFREVLPKPVIAPFVLDAEFQGLPRTNGLSGRKNLNYISSPITFKQDMQAFQEIVPFQKLGILVSQYLLDAFPDIPQRAETVFDEMGLEIQLVGVNNSIDDALAQLNPQTEAVYVLALMHLSETQFRELAQKLIDRKLPGFAYGGRELVEMGFMAGLNKDVLNRVARRVAINVQRILLGDPPESIPVTISIDKQLSINENTTKAIGVYPSWAVITEAEMVGHSQRKVSRQLNIKIVVTEALDANLDLAAQAYAVRASEQSIKTARAKLFPAVDLSGSYAIIDESRAEKSMGQQAERTLSGSLTATQVLFSEPAWAYLSIQKKLHKVREYERDQLELDIVEAAATSYLNVLRAKTYERIQQENLKRSRKNLELARVREIVGSAGPAEVYRWESEIASNRRAVIEANSQRNLAEIQLNRLLHRPAEESFATAEIDLMDPLLLASRHDLSKFFENPQTFKTFRKFMVAEALKNSPEMAALDAAISAQKRTVTSARNAFWAPTVVAQGGLNQVFSREGAGSSLPPGSFAQMPDDFSWQVGVSLTFPLFSGGEKLATLQQNSTELSQLETERQSVAEKLEQQMRSALHVAGASFASIKQARLAAGAAQKSLDVVQDAYSQGLVSQVELLDAQNSALITEEVASNAVYDFLIDMMQVERAYGSFEFLLSEQERIEIQKRAEDYFREAGIPLN